MKGKILIGALAVAVIGGGVWFGITQNKTSENKKNDKTQSNSVQQEIKDEMLYPHYDETLKKWGYINSKKEYVIEPKFGVANCFDKNMNGAVVSEQSIGSRKYGVIDKEGNYIIEPSYFACDKEEDYYRIQMYDGKGSYSYGLTDLEGNTIMEPSNGLISSISSNGLIFRKTYLGYGYYCNIDGDEILSFSDGGEFKNGYTYAKKEPEGKYGIINEKGEWVVEPFAERITDINKNGYAVYTNGDNNYGIVDINGNKSETKYYGTFRFSDNGFAMVQFEEDGKYAIINEKGEIIVEPKFDFAIGFNEDGVSVVKMNGKYGTINEKGEFITEPAYDDYQSQDDEANYFVIKNGTKTGIMGSDGKVIIEPF